MNFLAHAFLAGDAEADRIGGLMGDFVKGQLPAGLTPALAAGVALHRAIDSFADRHPAAKYFAIPKISRDQLEDWAQRKGMTLGEAERWLAPLL